MGVLNQLFRPAYWEIILLKIRLVTKINRVINRVSAIKRWRASRFARHQFQFFLGKPLNLNMPITFNQKLQWIKVLGRYDSEHGILADKLAVRDYVLDRLGDEYLIPLLRIYDHPRHIRLDELPAPCVLKLNHGSGWNVLVKDVENIDKGRTHEKLNRWFASNYYDQSYERAYENIKPKILCEQLLVDTHHPEAEVKDYKVFVFHGRTEFIQVDVDRHSNHHRVFYNRAWQKQSFTTMYPIFDGTIERPKNLPGLIYAAEKLAPTTPFSRIDFYILDDRIYFGEITFFHGGGHEPFYPPEWDEKLGKLINLDGVFI